MRLGGSAAAGGRGCTTPTCCWSDPDGRRLAVELELTAQGTRAPRADPRRATPPTAGSPRSCTSSRARGWPSRSARRRGGWASLISSTCSGCGGRATHRAPRASAASRSAAAAAGCSAPPDAACAPGGRAQARSCDAAVRASGAPRRDGGRTGCCSRFAALAAGAAGVGRSPGWSRSGWSRPRSPAPGWSARTAAPRRGPGRAAPDGVALGVDGDGRAGRAQRPAAVGSRADRRRQRRGQVDHAADDPHRSRSAAAGRWSRST